MWRRWEWEREYESGAGGGSGGKRFSGKMWQEMEREEEVGERERAEVAGDAVCG